ncbi:serine/threonine-protein kinase [soil metagenome]
MTDLPGYTLKRPLGRGGMATVYLATQESLGREVALKVLSPSQDLRAGERFLREARLAAQLNHPHIVPIYDFGVHQGQAWIAMQYLPLGTVAPLSGERLEPRAALRIVRDIADALDYAHSHGVVHRDIKPDNILRGEGVAMLSDFGIARLLEEESNLTAEGTSVGTPLYMSPEQLRGDKIDGRADLYSLGIVLWQLLTGDLPYTGKDGWAIGTQHLSAAIPRLPAPLSHLQPLIDALLAKSVDARPGSGIEVARWIDSLLAAVVTPTSRPSEALDTHVIATSGIGAAANSSRPFGVERRRADTGRQRWLIPTTVLVLVLALAGLGWHYLGSGGRAVSFSPATVPPSAGKAEAAMSSLAVLPFDDLSENHDQSYFSDGMAEEISNRLSQVTGLRVAGRTSAQSFKGKHATIAEIGTALNVSRVLEGSVRRSGDRLRVTVQLVNVADGFQLWTQTFDRKLTDVFAVQDEIAGAVVDSLKLKLMGEQRKHTPSVAAYDLYLQGWHALSQGKSDSAQRALAVLRKAVALDPDYASAHALLAMAEIFNSSRLDPQGQAEGKKRAMAAAERAVALDPGLGEGYGVRGFLRRLDWDWTGALEDAERSVALGSGDGRNHLRHGLILQALGRVTEAESALERAVAIDPLLTPAWGPLALAKTALGDYPGARAAIARVDAIDPDFLAGDSLSINLLLLEGKPAQARARYADMGFELGVILADHSLGKTGAARQALEALAAKEGKQDPYGIAVGYAWLGLPDQAFVWLDRAADQRSYGVLQLAQDPMLRSLRKDPRYAKLLQKVGIPVP